MPAAVQIATPFNCRARPIRRPPAAILVLRRLQTRAKAKAMRYPLRRRRLHNGQRRLHPPLLQANFQILQDRRKLHRKRKLQGQARLSYRSLQMVTKVAQHGRLPLQVPIRLLRVVAATLPQVRQIRPGNRRRSRKTVLPKHRQTHGNLIHLPYGLPTLYHRPSLCNGLCRAKRAPRMTLQLRAERLPRERQCRRLVLERPKVPRPLGSRVHPLHLSRPRVPEHLISRPPQAGRFLPNDRVQ